MKTIHPFPARMAPDAVSSWIGSLPDGSVVLDPMCGSGVVLRQSINFGHQAIGFDLDPLAVLMSSVWTTSAPLRLADIARAIVNVAQLIHIDDVILPWIDDCKETTAFVAYWFAISQSNQLRRLALAINQARPSYDKSMIDALWLSLSRVIITKSVGASLAWDVSHSRPHKKRETNDYDVYLGFIKAATLISNVLTEKPVSVFATVKNGDARRLTDIDDGAIDAIFTSPPYLNAIDYLRGHKFSLIWMGYTIPQLRSTRSISVGAERAANKQTSFALWEQVIVKHPELTQLTKPFNNIVKRYVQDAYALISEYARVLKGDGLLGLVIGDSTVRGTFVENSGIFDVIATNFGFQIKHRTVREILPSKRYLPQISSSNTLEKRMRHETISVYTRG